jgi:hypothetical protein
MPGEEFDFTDREIVLRADLASVDERDCVSVSLRFLMNGPRAPQPGERVVLVDMNGAGSCLGRVVSVSGWAAQVRPDWDTFSGGRPPRAARGHSLPPGSFGRGPTALG